MGTEPLTIGGWRTLVEAGVCDAAGALALRAALEAADQAVADRKLRRDGLDDVLQAALLVLCDTRAIECEDDVPLSEWFAGILPRLAQRERRAAARTTGRLLCEAEIASLAFRTFDRDDGESESPAEGSKPPFPPVTDAEQRAGEALTDTGSVAAAARRLGISVGALRSRLAHARRRNPARPPRKPRTVPGRGTRRRGANGAARRATRSCCGTTRRDSPSTNSRGVTAPRPTRCGRRSSAATRAG